MFCQELKSLYVEQNIAVLICEKLNDNVNCDIKMYENLQLNIHQFLGV